MKLRLLFMFPPSISFVDAKFTLANRTTVRNIAVVFVTEWEKATTADAAKENQKYGAQ